MMMMLGSCSPLRGTTTGNPSQTATAQSRHCSAFWCAFLWARCCLEKLVPNMYRHDRVVCPTDTGQAARVSVAMADAPATPKHYPDYILRPHFGYVLGAMVQFSTAPCATHHPHCLTHLPPPTPHTHLSTHPTLHLSYLFPFLVGHFGTLQDCLPVVSRLPFLTPFCLSPLG